MDLLAAGLPVLGSLFQHGLGEISAKRARDWEEYMYNQYNAPSALVRQYDAAGINPALMFGGQTPAAPTDTQAAPTPENPFGTVTGMVAQLLNLEQMPAAIDKLNAEADAARAAAAKSRADATGQDIENQFKPEILAQSLAKGEIDIRQGELACGKLQEDIKLVSAQITDTEEAAKLKAAQQIVAFTEAALNRMQTDESFSRIGVNNATALDITQDRFSKELDNAYFKEFGVHPSDGMWPQLIGVIRKTNIGRHDIGMSAYKLSQDAKGALLGLGATALQNAQKMSESAKNKWQNLGAGLNLP